MNWAATGGAFEELALWVGCGERHVEINVELRDTARHVLGHVFTDFDAQSFELDFFPFGDDAHDRGHARAEGGGY